MASQVASPHEVIGGYGRRRAVLTATVAFAFGATACASSDSGESIAASTSAIESTTTYSTVPESTTTATSDPTPAVAAGTFEADPTAYFSGVKAPDGSITFTGSAELAGDLVGTNTYTVEYSAADSAGVSTGISNGVFVGTLIGVGDGSFEIDEESTAQANGDFSITATLVGVSGVFVGMTGTGVSTGSGFNGDYQYNFVWS